MPQSIKFFPILHTKQEYLQTLNDGIIQIRIQHTQIRVKKNIKKTLHGLQNEVQPKICIFFWSRLIRVSNVLSSGKHSTKKPLTTMLTYPWKCTVLHCNYLGNTWKPLVLMTRHFDYCPSASEGDNQSVRSSAPVVSRCFPGSYNVKLYISRGRLAWWLLAFLHSESCIVEGVTSTQLLGGKKQQKPKKNKTRCHFFFVSGTITTEHYFSISTSHT